MSNKEWFIVMTEGKHGVYRYAIEYWLLALDGFESEEEYYKWLEKFKKYFVERTAIKERVVAVEPAQFLSAYSMLADNNEG